MPKVMIKKENLKGSINYEDSQPVQYQVSFPDKNTRQQIITYLTTPREFRIPESERIDDYRIDQELPVENITYFELALCELMSRLDVWVPSMPHNRLINIIEKILSVSNKIDISELRSGITRHHLLKGFAPPRHVLIEFCRQSQLCQVESTRIIADPPLNWEKVLSGTTEWIMTTVLKKNGPVMGISEFEKKCISLGINEYTFNQHISYSPILEKYSSGVYGLRGIRPHIGEIKTLKLKKARSKVLVDFGCPRVSF